jgi:predicted transcriptional regulator
MTKRYTDEELLDHLQRLAEELGRTPTERKINEVEGPSARTYNRRFGGFQQAQQAAGLEPNRSACEEEYTDEELLNHLQRLAEELGRTPTAEDIREADGPCPDTYRSRFGGIQEAQAAVGLEPNEPGGGGGREEKYTDEELLDWIRTWYEEFGCRPRTGDFDDSSSPMPSLSTYQYRFGSFPEAIDRALGDMTADGGGRDD